MDDFFMCDPQLKNALNKIARINHVLGGNKTTLDGLKKLLGTHDKNQSLKIVDIGCGSGDMLRMLAQYGRRKNLNFELMGLDANQFTIDYANSLSGNYKNIRYRCIDIFDPEFQELKFDIALCTLTLHHFKNMEIESLLGIIQKNARVGIVINDLQRSKLAYRLFQFYCFIFRINGMPRTDGLTSILRGFKKDELQAFSSKLKFKNDQINWKWAFRYQWIIPSL